MNTPADLTEWIREHKVCWELFPLKNLAIQVLPKENRPTRYQIEEFDAAFHIRPETNLKVEVVLKIFIIHQEDFFAPVDLCEQKCSAEIQILRTLECNQRSGPRN